MSDNISFVLRGIERVAYEQRPIPESKNCRCFTMNPDRDFKQFLIMKYWFK